MIKLLGAVIVIFASASVGFAAAQNLAKRTRELRELRLAIRNIESEITFNQISLSDILIKTSINMSTGLQNVFLSTAEQIKGRSGRTFVEIFSAELQNSKTHLKPEDVELIIHLLEPLGRSDIDNQKKALKMAFESLRALEEDAESNSRKYGKMYFTFGICAGLAATILMM